MTEIEIDYGKYTVIHNNGQGLHALRYGMEWRDLDGDKLILAMANEIEQLRKENDNYFESFKRAIDAGLEIDDCGEAVEAICYHLEKTIKDVDDE